MSDQPTNPWALFDVWMTEATAREPDVPDAMQLATVGSDGHPSLRTVLLKDWGRADGFVFYTNLGSRKARQLAATPRASLLLHWKSLARQVIAEGTVTRVEASKADAYWDSRPRGSQLGGWASLQSEPLPSRDDLDQRIARVTERFEGQPIPRPPFWSGFAIQPERIELWQGRADRLHDRRVFTRDGEGWRVELLYP